MFTCSSTTLETRFLLWDKGCHGASKGCKGCEGCRELRALGPMGVMGVGFQGALGGSGVGGVRSSAGGVEALGDQQGCRGIGGSQGV